MENNNTASPALTAPPKLYMPWHVLIINLLYFFSNRFTVAFDDTPFKKLIMPKQYKHIQNITRFTELICKIMIKHNVIYPPSIHFPTCTLLNTLVESSMPVIAPNGESKSDKPRLPSEKPSLYLIPGMEATHVPNKRLDVENKKPTASAGLFFMKEEMFLIIIPIKISRGK